LLQRLQSLLGLCGNTLSWFQSYLSGWPQGISVDGTHSGKFDLECGVPQGSCLGPPTFYDLYQQAVCYPTFAPPFCACIC
jgi:hypothetical protein